MSSPQPFDPYYEWLAIPPAEQPPHLYRLLGLQKYEPDPDVIEHAADRQMLFLRQFRSSPRWPYAESLLNSVARAKLELLDPIRKQAYDQALWQAEQAAAAATPPIPAGRPIAVQPSAEAAAAKEAVPLFQPAAATSAAGSSQRRRTRPASRASWVRLIGIILGGPTGIAIGFWLATVLGFDLLGTAPKPKLPPKAAAEKSSPPAPRPKKPPQSLPSRPEDEPALPVVVEEDPEPLPVAVREDTTPKIQPAAARVDVVAALPSSVELPPTTSSAPVTLFTTPADAGELDWAVRSSIAREPNAGSFLVRRATSDPRRWNILYSPDAQSSEQGIPIAKLLMSSSEVQFQWTAAGGDEAYQTSLGNCLLEARSASQTRSIQLRRPLTLAPLPFDLDQDESSVEFELPNLPPAETLLLEVSALPKGGAFEEGLASAKPGKPVVIQFAELPGAEISVRLQQKGTETGKLTLRAKPEFVEGPRLRFELTRPKLAEMTKRWNEMGQKAAVTIQQTQARIAALQDQLEELEGVSGNIAVMTQRAQQMKAVGERMKVEVERLPTHRKRLLEAEARLKAVPAVEKFLSSHDQSPIPFRIVAQVREDRIVLAESR